MPLHEGFLSFPLGSLFIFIVTRDIVGSCIGTLKGKKCLAHFNYT